MPQCFMDSKATATGFGESIDMNWGRQRLARKLVAKVPAMMTHANEPRDNGFVIGNGTVLAITVGK
jgi:hypothetical protein